MRSWMLCLFLLQAKKASRFWFKRCSIYAANDSLNKPFAERCRCLCFAALQYESLRRAVLARNDNDCCYLLRRQPRYMRREDASVVMDRLEFSRRAFCSACPCVLFRVVVRGLSVAHWHQFFARAFLKSLLQRSSVVARSALPPRLSSRCMGVCDAELERMSPARWSIAADPLAVVRSGWLRSLSRLVRPITSYSPHICRHDGIYHVFTASDGQTDGTKQPVSLFGRACLEEMFGASCVMFETHAGTSGWIVEIFAPAAGLCFVVHTYPYGACR